MCLYRLSSSKITGGIKRDTLSETPVVDSQSSFRIFHTSLSSAVYDNMEFHLTRQGGTSSTSKRYHRCFYPRVESAACHVFLCACRAALWTRYKIFRETYFSWGTRLIRYCKFLDSTKNPHRKATSIWITRSWNINRSTKFAAHFHRSFNIRCMFVVRKIEKTKKNI